MKSFFWMLPVLAICCSACTPNAPTTAPEQAVIGVVTKSNDSEYWMSVISGMQASADENGATLLILSPNSELESEVQYKLVETLVERGVDAIALAPIDSTAGAQYAELVQDIPLITYDTPFTDSQSPYIGIDNQQAGHALGVFLAEQLGNHGSVGIITGSLTQKNHLQRLQGFSDYITEQTDIHIAFVESGYSNLRISEGELQRLLSAYPEITGLMTTSAVTALGVADAIDTAQHDTITLVTVDAQDDALQAVQEGRIAGLIAQSGYAIGEQTITAICTMLAEQTPLPDTIVQAPLLSADTIAE